MCVVSIAWLAHPRWRLVVAGNRDEYHARPSASLARWDDIPGVIAGRDLVSGGTWIGVSEAGRFAVVTNIRNPDGPDIAKLSRGGLVSDWLATGSVPEHTSAFNPFNLIIADAGGLRYFSNRPASICHTLGAGIHGLSNAIADEHWPRKDRLDAMMSAWLNGAADDPDGLLDVLVDENSPDREAHPIFIRSPVYGTRCSTIVAIDHIGNGCIIERTFDADGQVTGETRFGFGVPPRL